jgi:beta-lactamase class A
MSLGSAFKLYVLAALAREVRQGTRGMIKSRQYQQLSQRYDAVSRKLVTLRAGNMMISISDMQQQNQLIAVLGRDAVLRAVIGSGHSARSSIIPFF